MQKRTFLVTGASKGIGNATAKILGAQGHTVIGLARTAPTEPLSGEFVAVDLLDRKLLKEVLADMSSKYKLDGIFNNVGLVNPEPAEEITEEHLNNCYHVNVSVALQCVQAALPNMKEQKWGRIVNTGSLTVVGVPFRGSYAAAKTALVSLARTWALEFAQYNITANTISPGPIETELFNTNNPPGSESRQRYIDGIPLRRTGTPEEVGEAVSFLMSDKGAFITGQNIFVDGGSSIGKSLI
ncbi:MAG: SDR family oxidoreductase [Fibrobacteria bacterium]|nr:SDR family oxidoreductase [Fibrobacteria bacterium]